MKTYNSIDKYDFIHVSENFLNSSFEPNDKDIMIEDYNLRGGACIYYRECLAVRAVNITSFTECLVCEVTIQNQNGYIAVV